MTGGEKGGEGAAGGSARTRHRALYRAIPSIALRERLQRLLRAGARQPVRGRAARYRGRRHHPRAPEHDRCRFLVDGACSVYERRPFACRLYGTTPVAPCPRGARPDPAVELPTAKAAALAERFEAGCPPSWHDDRRRAVRTVIERDGSADEQRALAEHGAQLAALRETLGLDER